MPTKREQMKAIRDEVLALPSSELVDFRKEHRSYPVIGEGNHDARVMFIGEAPGRNEAATGRPFCGAAGKILDELLAAIAVKREEVYVTNIVKDRPPGNRDPLPEEIALYAPLLMRQIDIIKPAVIATLGRFSMVYIMEEFGLSEYIEPISSAHGKVFKAKTMTIIPLYHPAAAIYTQTLKEVQKADIQVLKELV